MNAPERWARTRCGKQIEVVTAADRLGGRHTPHDWQGFLEYGVACDSQGEG